MATHIYFGKAMGDVAFGVDDDSRSHSAFAFCALVGVHHFS